jgi:hypothetical protein
MTEHAKGAMGPDSIFAIVTRVQSTATSHFLKGKSCTPQCIALGRARDT